jgi:UDP-glucose 4-epimerase
MNNSSLRILITGGAGFIGSHLVDTLTQEGHQVSVVDDLSSGHRNQVSSLARFYDISITNPELSTVMQQERPQVVIHHAAQLDVRFSVSNPEKDAQINVLGSLNLLETSIKCNVERFIFASSGGAMYGEPRQFPCSEENPIEPLSPYGAAKATVETYLHYYRQVHGLKSFALRYANVYGPRQDPHGEAGIIAIFTLAFLEGRTPIIFGDGEQVRDFVYVDDVVAANVACLTSNKPGSYNIGTGEGTSVNKIAATLQELTKSPLQPNYSEAKLGEVYRIALNANYAERNLNWTPRVKLTEGLMHTVEYFKSHQPAS